MNVFNVTIKNGIKKYESKIYKILAYDFYINKENIIDFKNQVKDNKLSGIYFLINHGVTKDGNSKVLYIGESENFLNRLSSHMNKKEWKDEDGNFVFNQVFFITNEHFLKTEISYLESKFIKDLNENETWNIHNKVGTSDANKSFPDHTKATLEGFYKHSCEMLELANIYVKKTIPKTRWVKEFFYKEQKLHWYGGNKFVLLKGTKIASKLSPSGIGTSNVANMHKLLLDLNDNEYVLKRDFKHTSSSPLAGVISGSPSSGPEFWKDKNGKKLGDYLKEQSKE